MQVLAIICKHWHTVFFTGLYLRSLREKRRNKDYILKVVLPIPVYNNKCSVRHVSAVGLRLVDEVYTLQNRQGRTQFKTEMRV